MRHTSALRASAGRILIFLTAAIVLIATLYPVSSVSGGGYEICVICGERGLADAILNVILFTPLGAAAAISGRSTRAALAIGAALSAGVELAQLTVVPGRNPSLGDLLFNTLGAAAGVGIVRTATWWMSGDRVRAARLSLVAAVFAMAVVAGTGLLFVPHLPRRPYVIMWTPALRHLDRYAAPVRSASIASFDAGPRRLEEAEELRQLLRDGAPVSVEAVAASRTSRQSAMVAIYDDLKPRDSPVGTGSGRPRVSSAQPRRCGVAQSARAAPGRRMAARGARFAHHCYPSACQLNVLFRPWTRASVRQWLHRRHGLDSAAAHGELAGVASPTIQLAVVGRSRVFRWSLGSQAVGDGVCANRISCDDRPPTNVGPVAPNATSPGLGGNRRRGVGQRDATSRARQLTCCPRCGTRATESTPVASDRSLHVIRFIRLKTTLANTSAIRPQAGSVGVRYAIAEVGEGPSQSLRPHRQIQV